MLRQGGGRGYTVFRAKISLQLGWATEPHFPLHHTLAFSFLPPAAGIQTTACDPEHSVQSPAGALPGLMQQWNFLVGFSVPNVFLLYSLMHISQRSWKTLLGKLSRPLTLLLNFFFSIVASHAWRVLVQNSKVFNLLSKQTSLERRLPHPPSNKRGKEWR